MHIPDGYLGPATYGSAFAVMIPVWAWASSRVRKSLRMRQVPALALAAAFSFLVMMFNIPIPGGTTGHAVGSVLIAILMGPWAAVIAESLVLVVQALVFGDGGVTAIGANCITMAVIMPFTGWWVFRLLAGRAAFGSKRRWLAASVAGYVGLNAAAFVTAVLFGIQPAIAHDAAGRALYAPFGLSIAVPAMVIEHLLVFGLVEAAVTGFAVAYFDKTEPQVFGDCAAARSGVEVSPPFRLKKVLIFLGILVLLSPLGLLLPDWLGTGSAWGEWSAHEIGGLAGYVPAGLEKLSALWRAPVPDYGPPGGGPGLLRASLWGTCCRGSWAQAFSSGFSWPPGVGSQRERWTAMLPDWLEPQIRSAGAVRIRRSGGRMSRTARRTLAELGKALAVTLSDRTTAETPGLLQGFDPRAKVVGFLALILAVSVQESVATLGLVCLACALLAVASHLPGGRFAAVLMAAPLFSALIIAPAALNVVSGGMPLLTLWPPSPRIGGPHLAITEAGLVIASRFVLRTTACVSLAILLAATTGAPRLFRGLRAVGVPALFVMILAMMERYVEVLVRVAGEIHLARVSRSLAPERVRGERMRAAAGIGALFRRTRRLGNAVYDAMISRGYTGEARTWEALRMRGRDAGFVVVTVATATFLVIFRRGL